MKSGTAIEHAVNSVVTESVNIHNHSEVIQRVNYGFSCWQAYHLLDDVPPAVAGILRVGIRYGVALQHAWPEHAAQ